MKDYEDDSPMGIVHPYERDTNEDSINRGLDPMGIVHSFKMDTSGYDIDRAVKVIMDEADPAVERPPHYNTGNIECIDYLKDNLPTEAYQGYLEGNAKKYLHRWRYKGKGKQDLQKAIWYLQRLEKEID